MLRSLSSFLLLLSLFSLTASADELTYIGEGTRQNTVAWDTFDSYKLVHYAANSERDLSPLVERSLHFTMIASWGTFFTKGRMIDALEQALQANSTRDELGAMASEITRFKKTMLALPINAGTELEFQHIPGSGLHILMKGRQGFSVVFNSEDENFSMKIFSIWLGKAHASANNRDNLASLIEALWGQR